MITIYKNKKDIPQGMEYVELNDVFFNQNTAGKFDKRAGDIIARIDDSKLLGKFKIESKFNQVILDVDCLSTGCKTVLNVMYFPDKVFCIKECGDNAIDVIYDLQQGKIYSEYPVISFDMSSVRAVDDNGEHIFESYEELKEWWEDV